ncbi:MAG TPA: T9SS type A sorting domain-containing protein [Bacteroidia bacterium]|nr:T9SS type A sorting domain-containing protein [Bacteroidia bacterium]
MKKFYLLITSFSLCLLAIGVSAQSGFNSSTAKHFNSPSFRKNFSNHNNPTSGPVVYTLDYDSADAAIYGANYYHNQGDLMNMHYAYPKDTVGGNYDCINYVTVAFDSMIDPYQKLSMASTAVTGILVDTIYVPIVQLNKSGVNDTLEIDLMSCAATGYPSVLIKDTLMISKAIGANNDNSIVLKKWAVKYTLTTAPKNKFAVSIKYSGAKTDSCWLIYGFGSFTGPCPTGSNTLATFTNFSKVGNGTTAYKGNSFKLYNADKSSGTLPTVSGGDIYYNCWASPKGVGKDTTGDGQDFLQNVNIFATVTLNPIITGVSEIENDFSVSQNFPNPFNKATQINYSVTKSSDVVFTVYDITGRKLINNTYNEVTPGEHEISLGANQFTPGVYFYTFNVNGNVVTKKMVVTQ